MSSFLCKNTTSLMENTACFSTSFFPPISYFIKLLEYKRCKIEACENFVKQTYRNRCNVLSSNGIQPITVPVQRANSKIPIQKIEIDYAMNWQVQHQRTLLASYGSSPFYEYYIDDFSFVFEEKTETLWELNHRILNVCLELLQITPNVEFTSKYETKVPNDFRMSISPKSKQKLLDFIPYYQVFSDKFPFCENLSILDLLFNVGTEAEIYLLKHIKS